jgi:Reverse transcriptase (RNA-dependent DNA polymerase)
MDGTDFFYQWRVAKKDREKFTIISHRGLETSNVAIMGYKGSPPYVQRMMDLIFRPYKSFARCYVDDIVVFSKTLDEHIEHLNTILGLFDYMGMTIKSVKTFLGYPSIIPLGQRVDGFGLTTSEERVAAIRNLGFPRILKDLETNLGFTGWLRQYILYYAQLTELF